MNTHRRIRKLERGVSLLEVMVTVLIVTGGLVVVMSSFVGMQKSSRYVEKMETANSLLRLEMEMLRNIPYSSIRSSEANYGTAWSDQQDFRRQLIVTDLGNLKRVRVLVYFDGDKHVAEATTIIARL